MFTVASTTARRPRARPTGESVRPVTSTAPTRITPWIAFAPLISGGCSVVDTFETTSKPTNTDRTKKDSRVTGSTSRSFQLQGGRLVPDLAVVRQAGAREHLVGQVHPEAALVVQHQPEQVRHVLGVQPARVDRQGRGRITHAEERGTAHRQLFPGDHSLDVAAALGSQVDD